jgi:hypothetical protein
MRKKLAIAAILALIIIMTLQGCEGYNYFIEGGPAAADEVTNNGSMAVRKGDYIFFINGVSSTVAENEFGKPVKGSIVRFNLKNKEKKIAVPKVVLSSYNEAGIFIFGDRIYYASPSIEKDKKGQRLSSYLDFFSTKLNGTDTKKIITLTSNSFPFKFYQSGGNVYMLYIDSGAGKIYNVDCRSGARRLVLEGYSGNPIMADDGYIYYNEIIYKDENKTQAYTYNMLKRVKYDGSGAGEIKYSGGKTITDSKYTVTINAVKVIDGKTVLFYSKKSATDISSEQTLKDPYIFSYVMGEDKDKMIMPVVSGQFEYTNITYLTATSLVGVYNGKLYYVEHNGSNPAVPAQTALMDNPAKILKIDTEYIYYLKSIGGKNVLHKKLYKGDDVEQFVEGVKLTEDGDVSISYSGLAPVFYDGYLYFLAADGDNINYMYRFKLTGGEKSELISIIEDEDEEE